VTMVERLLPTLQHIHTALTGPSRLVDRYPALKMGFFYYTLRNKPTMLLDAINEALEASSRSLTHHRTVKELYTSLLSHLEEYKYILDTEAIDPQEVEDNRIKLLENAVSQAYQQLLAVVRLRSPRPKKSPAAQKIRSDSQDTQLTGPASALFYSTSLLAALQEVLDYDNVPNRNSPSPALRIDDPSYLKDVRELVDELRRYNELLQSAGKTQKKTRQRTTILAKHFHKFLDNYIPVLGKGAAALTITTVGGLLYQVGGLTPSFARFLTSLKVF